MTIRKVRFEGAETVLTYAVQELTRRGYSTLEIIRLYPKENFNTIKFASAPIRKAMGLSARTRKITFSMIEEAADKLIEEAASRRMPAGQFIALLLDAIATDNMYSAILDDEDHNGK
jgi:hypothetical protein